MAISSSLTTSKSELVTNDEIDFQWMLYIIADTHSHIKTISLTSSYNCVHQLQHTFVYSFPLAGYAMIWICSEAERLLFSPFCCDIHTRSHVTHTDSFLLQQGKKSTNELALSWSKSASIWWTACRPGCAQGELWCHDRFRSNPITLHLSKINKKIFHLARMCVHATRLPLVPSTRPVYLFALFVYRSLSYMFTCMCTGQPTRPSQSGFNMRYLGNWKYYLKLCYQN